MFRKIILASTALLCSAVTAFAAPQPPQTPPQPVRISESAAFQEVIRNLDQNGLSLKYGNADFIRETLTEIILTVLDQPGCKDDAQIQFAANIAGSIWKDSGLNAVHAVGSSLRRDGNAYLYREFIYAPQQSRQGFIWELFPESSVLPMLDLMPQNASIVIVSNLNGGVLWKVIDDNVKKFTSAEQKKEYEKLLADCRKDGFDVSKIMSSVTGFGFCGVCDLRQFQNPDKAAGSGLPFSGTLILSVKDRSLFDQILARFQKQSPELVKNGEILLPIPVGMVSIFQQGNYLFATMDAAGFKERMKSPAAPRLAVNKDFIAASKGMPACGHAWAYVAPNFVSQTAMLGAMMIPPDSGIDLFPFIRMMGLEKSTFSVSGSTPEGYFSVTRTGSRALALLLGYPEIGSMLSSTFMSVVKPAFAAAVDAMDDALDGDDDADDDADDDNGKK